MAMAQSTASGTSSRRYMREHDVGGSSSSRYMDSEWETKEALRQRELEEARARAAQMEKTMRWWSDCTANWREKWSKVRNERNMAREEAKVLRAKLEIAMKDANSFKHEAQEVEHQNEQLKKEMEKIHMILLKHAGQFDQQLISVLQSDPQLKNALDVEELLAAYNNIQEVEQASSQKDSISPRNVVESPRTANSHVLPDRDIEEYVLQGAVPKHAVELYKENSNNTLNRDVGKAALDYAIEENNPPLLEGSNEDMLLQKISMLQSALEEALKSASAEKEEKHSLHRGMEKMKAKIVQLQEQCEQVQASRAEAMKELLELLELKDRFRVELSAAQADLIDEASNREGMDRRLSELRAELERLQAENAAEWGKRERLESEKLSLERENKQLRNELNDLQERVEARRIRPISSADTDLRQLQQELADRSKEIAELKNSQAKLKKLLGEKTTELCHAMRRSEQYEAEVKRVRARVEELKKELAAVQDEVDTANNNVKKLQRVNEDLMEQLEAANLHLDHFRNSSESSTTDAAAPIEISVDKSQNNDETDKGHDIEQT
ncbi:coiled-coil domain-containing protein 102A-like isoform X1 [Prorops nasuta]|uniref:coiled-coil domain-containing protein 102A-like isoform X1 n=1 Tax=Prorops nasuta TaxID=863751 RepID=UPI0034CD4A40